MGAIKGIFVVLFSILLFLSLCSTIFFLNLSDALEYKSLQKNSVNFIKDIIKEKTDFDNILSENLQFMQVYCFQKTNSSYSFNLGNYTLDVPCKENLTVDYILEEGIKNLEEDIYFNEYNCSFIDCFKENELPLFLVSYKTYSFLYKYFYLSLILSFLLALGLFFLLEKKSNLLLLLGVLLIIPSFLSASLRKIPSFFHEPLISQVLNVLLSNSYFLSIKLIVFSVMLIVFWVIFKIFKLGILFSNFISKNKKAGKEETSSNSLSKKNNKTKNVQVM